MLIMIQHKLIINNCVIKRESYKVKYQQTKKGPLCFKHEIYKTNIFLIYLYIFILIMITSHESKHMTLHSPTESRFSNNII